MESLHKKRDDGVPNLLKLFEKTKIEEHPQVPEMQSAIQRVASELKQNFSETDGENFFFNEDKDEEELTMILSNSGNVHTQLMESSMDQGTDTTNMQPNSCGELGHMVHSENQKMSQCSIRRPFPENVMQEELDAEGHRLRKLNPKGFLSQLRNDELCTFLAAALTSAAAVRKIPKANFTSSPSSSPSTEGCDDSVSPVRPLEDATISLCRTFNSINNDSNNNCSDDNKTPCDFRSPPCKRVKLQNRPCLDFEKMHKQKACSSFQSSNKSTTNWKSTGEGLASSTSSSSSTALVNNNYSIINLSNNNNNTSWGSGGGVTKLHKLELSVACSPSPNSRRAMASSEMEEEESLLSVSPLSSLQHHIQSLGTGLDDDVIPYPHPSPVATATSAISPSSSPCSSPILVTSEEPAHTLVTRVPLVTNGDGSPGRPVVKHHGNSIRGARYNYHYIHHNNNHNNNASLFGPTHYQQRNHQQRETMFGDERFVPHRRTKHATPHHLKVISNGSNLDLRHLNRVIGVRDCSLESSTTEGNRRQSFVPICFPTNSSLPAPTLSNNSLFAVGSNFRSLCTAGTQ